jgi:hypothetical protein
MGETAASIQTRLDNVNTEIDAIIANTDGKALDYSIEGIKVNKSKRLDLLIKLRKELQANLADMPCEEETEIDEPYL